MSEVNNTQQEATVEATIPTQPNEEKPHVFRRARKATSDTFGLWSDGITWCSLHLKASIESSKRDLAIKEIKEEKSFNKELDKVLSDIPEKDLAKYSKETKQKVNTILSFL